MNSVLRGRSLLAALFLCVMVLACEESQPSEADRPLRPLVYTELPEITPEAAAVRERRIMRRLVQGSLGKGRWGDLEPRDEIQTFETADALGQAIFKALSERDSRLWDTLFVEPKTYASLVGLEKQQAADFVDEVQGASTDTWRLFEPEPASQAPEGGMAAIFGFASLELGEPRGLDGRPVDDPAEAVQYWNNVLRIDYRRQQATFEFRIPKILRVAPAPQKTTLALASSIDPPARLRVLFDAGLHLKPEMLRSGEYPMPIQVGTFWRYRRMKNADANVDPLLADHKHATEVVVDVVSVDRYQSMRLVKMRRSYNDSELTKVDQWWLATPRRMDLCDRRCRRGIQDFSTVLDYLSSNVPAFVFPPQAGSWPESKPVFEATSVESVEVPAGVFTAVLAVQGQGGLGSFDRRMASPQLRYFAVGQGIVKREIASKGEATVEELVDFRIMP